MEKDPDYVYSLDLDVRDYELDLEGIVNNANYLHYMEHTRHMFCRHAGLSFREMHARGIAPVLRRAEVDYLTPLRSGDTFRSCLAMKRVGVRFIFRQDLFRLPDMAPVARGKITVACLENGRLSRGDALADAFKEYLR